MEREVEVEVEGKGGERLGEGSGCVGSRNGTETTHLKDSRFALQHDVFRLATESMISPHYDH